MPSIEYPWGAGWWCVKEGERVRAMANVKHVPRAFSSGKVANTGKPVGFEARENVDVYAAYTGGRLLLEVVALWVATQQCW